MASKFQWRGIFEGQKVAKFRSAKDCHAAKTSWGAPSNPKGDPFHQYISVVVGWAQLQKYIFPVLDESRRKIDGYKWADPKLMESLPEHLKNLWRCAPYRLLNRDRAFEATLNTFEYMYRTMRCGIFVRISGGKVVLFVPFVNPDYRNDWSEDIVFEGGSYEAYVEGKNKYLKFPEAVIKDKSQWWLNGNILCNVASKDLWGDAYLPHLRDMLDVTCDLHEVPDVEFFINKRDFPQLRKDLTSPYSFIYHHEKRPPRRPGVAIEPHHLSYDMKPVYAPIMSFYGSEAFADVLIPTAEDWEIATGDVFPPYGLESRTKEALKKASSIPWRKRKADVVFRGGATGGGVDPLTNLRLAVAAMDGKVEGFDVGVVKWNLRDKKLEDEVCVRHLKPDRLPFGLKPYMGLEDQCKYKYHLYIDGHCAANRLGTMLGLGSTIIRVVPPGDEPHLFPHNEGEDSWLTPLLCPFNWKAAEPGDLPSGSQDHLRCSVYDLPALLTWMRANDEICEILAENAAFKAKRYISVDYITTHWYQLLLALHRRTQGGSYSRWFSPSETSMPEPTYRPKAPPSTKPLNPDRQARIDPLLTWEVWYQEDGNDCL